MTEHKKITPKNPPADESTGQANNTEQKTKTIEGSPAIPTNELKTENPAVQETRSDTVPTADKQTETQQSSDTASTLPDVNAVGQPATQIGDWFVVHTYSGHENKVATALKQRIDAMRLEAKIFEVIVPTRNIVVVRHGKKEEIKEKIFPGYIIIRMKLDDESWLAVRTTPGVTSFVGVGNKPTPIAGKEVDAILKFSKLSAPKFKTKFGKGEAVKIIDGPFADFLGTVDSIDDDKGKVKVLVSIFGRETPVELDFLQVAKL